MLVILSDGHNDMTFKVTKLAYYYRTGVRNDGKQKVVTRSALTSDIPEKGLTHLALGSIRRHIIEI